MIGEKSLQDRLARYKQVANVKDKKTSKSRHSNKYKNNFVPEKPVVILENSFTPPTTPTTSEVIRPPPAGAKETINYSLSIDLKETKALFESPERKSRKSFRKKRSTSSSRSLSPKSSRSSSCHSYTLKSQDDSDVINTEMAEIVRPPPAGTKEVVDIQPSLSISAVKSLFEKNKSGSNVVDSEAPKRRQLRSDWASEDSKKEVVVAEGSFVEDNGVVRPPTAGTKEKPNYQLESNALKSRAAIFQVGKVNEYQPRNRVQKEEKKPAAEIVNRKDVDEQEEDFVPSIDQKTARNVFENHQETSSAPRTVNDVVPAANLSAAKGVFSGEVVAENNKKQDQKEEIPEVEAPKEAPVDLPTETPEEAPVDLPTEAPEETRVELPVEAPEEAPVDLPVEAPEETRVDLPVETRVEAPTEIPFEIPFEIPVSFET